MSAKIQIKNGLKNKLDKIIDIGSSNKISGICRLSSHELKFIKVLGSLVKGLVICLNNHMFVLYKRNCQFLNNMNSFNSKGNRNNINVIGKNRSRNAKGNLINNLKRESRFAENNSTKGKESVRSLGEMSPIKIYTKKENMEKMENLYRLETKSLDYSSSFNDNFVAKLSEKSKSRSISSNSINFVDNDLDDKEFNQNDFDLPEMNFNNSIRNSNKFLTFINNSNKVIEEQAEQNEKENQSKSNKDNEYLDIKSIHNSPKLSSKTSQRATTPNIDIKGRLTTIFNLSNHKLEKFEKEVNENYRFQLKKKNLMDEEVNAQFDLNVKLPEVNNDNLDILASEIAEDLIVNGTIPNFENQIYEDYLFFIKFLPKGENEFPLLSEFKSNIISSNMRQSFSSSLINSSNSNSQSNRQRRASNNIGEDSRKSSDNLALNNNYDLEFDYPPIDEQLKVLEHFSDQKDKENYMDMNKFNNLENVDNILTVIAEESANVLSTSMNNSKNLINKANLRNVLQGDSIREEMEFEEGNYENNFPGNDNTNDRVIYGSIINEFKEQFINIEKNEEINIHQICKNLEIKGDFDVDRRKFNGLAFYTLLEMAQKCDIEIVQNEIFGVIHKI